MSWKTFLFLLFTMPMKLQVFAQDDLVNIPSPEAASFSKYNTIPVSTYSGTPQIEIPLFNIKAGNLSLPISLSYHANGIKVEEDATWVGLGWDLNAGGMITRAIRGLDDLTPGPGTYLNVNTNPGPLGTTYGYQAQPETGTAATCCVIMSQFNGLVQYFQNFYNAGVNDYQPDLYYLNMGSLSGKFIMNTSGQWMFLNKTNAKIANSGLGGFVITGEDGTQYTFHQAEWTQNYLNTTPGHSVGTSYVQSSWFLTNITSADKNDSIIFKYKSEADQITTNPSTVYSLTVGGQITTPVTTINTYYSQVTKNYLSEIDYNGNRVVLTSTEDRKDVVGSERLNSMLSYDQFNNPQKQYNFYYSYFQAGGTDTTTNTCRLRLDSLKINNDTLDTYSFSYYQGYLATKIEGGDHWGYPNGSLQGFANGIYPTTLMACGGNFTELQQFGQDREAHFPNTEAFILNKITYPTKGYTQYTYEPNEYSNLPSSETQALKVMQGAVNYPATNINNGTVPFSVSANSCASIASVYQGGCSTLYVQLQDVNGNSLYTFTDANYSVGGSNIHTLTSNNFITLNAGNYQLKVFTTNPTSCPASAFQSWGLTVSFPANDSVINLNIPKIQGGGLRVKQITNFDGVSQTTYKKFQYDRDSSSTWGKLMGPFKNYDYGLISNYVNQSILSNAVVNINSRSMLQLNTSASGSYVGYDTVIVTEGDTTNNGSVQYHYVNYPDIPPPAGPIVQFYQNGLLLSQITKNGQGQMLNKIVNLYNTYDSTWKSNTGLYVQVVYNYNDGFYQHVDVLLHFFGEAQLNYNCIQHIETAYSGNDSLQEVTNYVYNDHHVLKKQTTTNSKNQTVCTEYRYPYDFKLSTVPPFIKEMQDSNIIAKPVEVVSYIVNTSLPNSAISGSLNQYGTGVQRGLATKRYGLAIQAPINWDSTQFSSILSNATFNYNSNYLLKDSIAYGNGNVAQYQKNSDEKVSYLWDYHTSLPVAVAKNCAQSDMAFTSFEADGTGNWNNYMGTITTVSPPAFPPTGNKYYNLTNSAPLSKSGVTVGNTYIISYWSEGAPYTITGGNAVSSYVTGKTIGLWTYYEHKIQATSTTLTITGTGPIDEVRLYSSGAQMTTYTYSPLVGISCQCDMDNRISYYYYDAMGRLRYVKDQDGNILKTVQYHYQAQ